MSERASLLPTSVLAEAVMSVADAAGAPSLASAARAASDETAVLEAIAKTVTDEARLPLLRAGLFDAVVDHASGGFLALKQTGDALVVRCPYDADEILGEGHAYVAHRNIAVIEAWDGRDDLADAPDQTAGRIVRASPGVHELALNGSHSTAAMLCGLMQDVAASPWLGSLDFGSCQLSLDGSTALSRSLGPEGGAMSLVLSNCRLCAEGFVILATAAAESEVFERLHLSSCGLGPSAGSALGGLLAATMSLTELDIAHIALGDEGVVSLARGLAHNASLSSLSVRGVGLREGGASALSRALASNSALQRLEAGWDGPGGPVVTSLSERIGSWPGLRELVLSGPIRSGDCAAPLGEALRRNTRLERLQLSTWAAGGEGLEALASVLGSPGTAMARLDVGVVSHPKGCAEALMAAGRDFRAGAGLRLHVPSGTDAAHAVVAAGLPRCSGLRSLVLNGQPAAPDSVRRLGEALLLAPWLTELGLEVGELGAVPGGALARGIAASTGLTSLNLKWFEEDDAGCVFVVRAVASLPAMSSLRVVGPGVGDEGASTLGAALARWAGSLRELDLSSCGIRWAGVAALSAGLRSCAALQRLCLGSNEFGCAGAAAHAGALQGCPALTSLSCVACSIGGEGMGALLGAARALPDLSTIVASRNIAIREEDWLAALAACRRRDAARRRRCWLRRRRVVSWRQRLIG